MTIEEIAKELEDLYCELTEKCNIEQPKKCQCWKKLATHIHKMIVDGKKEYMGLLKQTIPFLKILADFNNEQPGDTQDSAYYLLKNIEAELERERNL
jgi:hypothetical protein